MRFDGKVLFATGGGSGLAAATARRYTAEGGRVAVVDLDLDRAQAVAAELEGAIAVACDVSDEQAVEAAVAETRERLGRIDSVFNAAGHVVFGPIESYPLAEWNRTLAVHVTGTFLVCRSVLPALREAGGGAIVNVASVAALVGRSRLGAYSAAKGAIIAFSRQLAVDLGPENIRVNVVAPGSVRTAMTEPVWTARGGGDLEKGAAMTGEEAILKRVGEAHEIAATVCFLLSDDASFFTASLLVPDGGMTAV
jgi:NAD(P)-dependent dehydrogenase (short-subunit alcohol dehydrogenase family)